MTSLYRDAMPSTEGSAQPSTTLEVSSSHPRVSSIRPLPFPAFTRDRVPAGLLSGAATVGYREVWTLSDSALEPSSRRPAPTMNQQFLGRFEDLGLVSPRALVSVRERTRSSSFHYSWSVGSSEPSAYAVVGFRRDDPSTTEPTTIRSALSSRAMFLNERVPQPMLGLLLSPRNPSVERTHSVEV